MKKYILVILSIFIIILSSCSKDENPVTPTTGTIAGKVLNSTGDTVLVNAAVFTNPPTSSVFTNAAGEYSISDVSPGDYTVNVTKSGFFDGSVTVKVNAGSTTAANIQMIRIVDQTGMIRGKVTNAGGDTLIAGASVTTSPATSSVTTNSLGEYTISNVNPDAYTVTATKTGYNEGNTAVTVLTGKVAVGDIKMNVIVNHAPNTPVLVSPSNGFAGLPCTLTLSWTCSDPDGDNLTYDVYLDKTTTPTQKIATDITATSYTATNLDSAATYYWRIIAKDNKGAVSNSSSINSFRTIFLTAGLVAYYPFNGNANDESGSGHNGTNYGAILTTDRFNRANTAFSFNGTSSYIKASANGLPTAERTTSAWFYTSNLTKQHVLLAYGGNSPSPPGTSWFLTVSPTFFNVAVHFDTNSLQYYFSTQPVGSWYNFVAVTSSNGTKIYINGVLKANNSNYINNTYVSGRDFSIGVCVDRNGLAPFTDANVDYFNGKIDDVRLYNRALTESEIQALYQEGGW
jgi:hypothetical protein